MKNKMLFLVLLAILMSAGCSNSKTPGRGAIPVILDTDANNELDDQHAIAYLLCNPGIFDILGITVNATRYGGDVDSHYEEALRIMTLFGAQHSIPLKKGANASFGEIRGQLDREWFDGIEAVKFIVGQARIKRESELVLLPIGKLTNIALALAFAPDISEHIRIVWLGSNFPLPGEYNLENDTSALHYILDSNVKFEVVTVSYGCETGTAAIRISLDEIDSLMPGKGPFVSDGITGRHGGQFNTFGDYSVDLFHHIALDGEPPSRSLFDVGALAVTKNPSWAESRIVYVTAYDSTGWLQEPGQGKEITVWENFQKDSILKDLFKVLD